MNVHVYNISTSFHKDTNTHTIANTNTNTHLRFGFVPLVKLRNCNANVQFVTTNTTEEHATALLADNEQRTSSEYTLLLIFILKE